MKCSSSSQQDSVVNCALHLSKQLITVVNIIVIQDDGALNIAIEMLAL